MSVPIWAGQVVSGASLSAWVILRSLLLLVLIRLVVGLAVRPLHRPSGLVIIVIVVALGLLLGGRQAQVWTTTGLVSGIRFGSLYRGVG